MKKVHRKNLKNNNPSENDKVQKKVKKDEPIF